MRKRRWWQFSLRQLCVLVVIVAALCAFSLIPTVRARQFASALQGGRYDVAITLCPRLEDVDDATWRSSGVQIGLASPTLRECRRLERHIWLAKGTHLFLFRATLTEIQLVGITVD